MPGCTPLVSATAGKPSPLGRARTATLHAEPHSTALLATSGCSTPAHASTTAAEPALATATPPLLARVRSANARRQPASFALDDAASSACSSPSACSTPSRADGAADAPCAALAQDPAPSSPPSPTLPLAASTVAQARTASATLDLELSPQEVRKQRPVVLWVWVWVAERQGTPNAVVAQR